VTVKSLYWKDGPKSPCAMLARVAAILPQQRLVEMVDPLEIASDLDRHAALLVERPRPAPGAS